MQSIASGILFSQPWQVNRSHSFLSTSSLLLSDIGQIGSGEHQMAEGDEGTSVLIGYYVTLMGKTFGGGLDLLTLLPFVIYNSIRQVL